MPELLFLKAQSIGNGLRHSGVSNHKWTLDMHFHWPVLALLVHKLLAKSYRDCVWPCRSLKLGILPRPIRLAATPDKVLPLSCTGHERGPLTRNCLESLSADHGLAGYATHSLFPGSALLWDYIYTMYYALRCEYSLPSVLSKCLSSLQLLLCVKG